MSTFYDDIRNIHARRYDPSANFFNIRVSENDAAAEIMKIKWHVCNALADDVQRDVKYVRGRFSSCRIHRVIKDVVLVRAQKVVALNAPRRISR